MSNEESTSERLERSKARFDRTAAHFLRSTVHQWMGKFELTVVNPEGVGRPILDALDALAIAHDYEAKAAELDDVFRKVLAEPEPVDTFDEEKTWTPSTALVANGTRGIVLEYRGMGIATEIQEAGGCALEDIGLDGAPEGLSIWEGDYRPSETNELENEAVGAFRPLNEEEWEMLRRGDRLWSDEK